LFVPATLPQASDESPPAPDQLMSQTPDVRGQWVAVNLCDQSESDLRLPEISEQAAGNPPPGGASPWFYLALLALGLVLGEWVLFNRRVIA
jgi:hypothetical protein